MSARGIFDGDEYSEPEGGMVYLHHVLDGWFERDVVPRICGRARLIRYADDAVIGFEYEADAWKVLGALRKRFERRQPPLGGDAGLIAYASEAR